MEAEQLHMEILKTVNLIKKYSSQTVVEGFNLKLNKAAFLGLVGLNGAGKTTVINMLTGLVSPTSGSINMFGSDLKKDPIGIKKRIGVVTEDMALFDHLKADEQLYFSARIYGVEKSITKNRMDELFDLFDLKNHRKKFVFEFSKGMKKKLALMCAIIHSPEILFLDEPFDGLDPISKRVIQDNLVFLRKNSVTIFLTSHNLALVENICTEIAIIHHGKIIFHNSIKKIREHIKTMLSKNQNMGLEELFIEIVAPEFETKYLSWYGK